MDFSQLSKCSHEIVFAKEPRFVSELVVYPVIIIGEVEAYGEGVGASGFDIVKIEAIRIAPWIF